MLEGENPVKEWTKGTWLTRYLDVLKGEEKAAFEAAYGERVAKAYPQNSAGQTLFPVPAAVHGGAAQGLTPHCTAKLVRHLCRDGGLGGRSKICLYNHRWA